VADLNARLHSVFEEFWLDTLHDGALGILPVLRADVTERYAEDMDYPLARGPAGAKPVDLPERSPVAIFTNGSRPPVLPIEVDKLERNTQLYRCTKWKRSALRASHPYADEGPKSSSVPSRCSDLPGGATYFGSGRRLYSSACSASERYAEVMMKDTPSARAAAANRSKARTTSGLIGLPTRYLFAAIPIRR
jgi:hypothetical protein